MFKLKAQNGRNNICGQNLIKLRLEKGGRSAGLQGNCSSLDMMSTTISFAESKMVSVLSRIWNSSFYPRFYR